MNSTECGPGKRTVSKDIEAAEAVKNCRCGRPVDASLLERQFSKKGICLICGKAQFAKPSQLGQFQ